MRTKMKRQDKGDFEVEAALARLQEVAREQAERVSPYADQAKATAAHRLYQARGWTAPRLETAAHRVEDTLAPLVSDLLSAAAHRVEPNKAKRGLMTARHNGRRVPRTAIYAGVGAIGAAAVYGALRLRRAAQEAEWQENLDQAREQVRETREQLTTKAKDAKEKVTRAAGNMKGENQEADAAPDSKESTRDFNGRVKK